MALSRDSNVFSLCKQGRGVSTRKAQAFLLKGKVSRGPGKSVLSKADFRVLNFDQERKTKKYSVDVLPLNRYFIYLFVYLFIYIGKQPKPLGPLNLF